MGSLCFSSNIDRGSPFTQSVHGRSGRSQRQNLGPYKAGAPSSHRFIGPVMPGIINSIRTSMKAQTERLGVSKLDHYFSSYGWLFREQMIHDYGIDAHVEITNENYPTGELIAIQIKSGMSFFL